MWWQSSFAREAVPEGLREWSNWSTSTDITKNEYNCEWSEQSVSKEGQDKQNQTFRRKMRGSSARFSSELAPIHSHPFCDNSYQSQGEWLLFLVQQAP